MFDNAKYGQEYVKKIIFVIHCNYLYIIDSMKERERERQTGTARDKFQTRMSKVKRFHQANDRKTGQTRPSKVWHFYFSMNAGLCQTRLNTGTYIDKNRNDTVQL